MNDSIVAIVGGLSGSDKHSNDCVSSYVIEKVVIDLDSLGFSSPLRENSES